MELVRYNPWRVAGLRNEIGRLFDSLDDNSSSAATADWIPSVDIQEFSDRFELFVDLPGVDPEAVEITLDRGVLTVSGERNPIALNDDEKVLKHRAERGSGRFHRRFALPNTVDAENVNARNNNGVLAINIPKQATAKPRRIKVAA